VTGKRFEGKVALVTGGNSGIGFAVAQALVGEGAKVVVSGRDAETLARAATRLGPSAQAVQADVARLADIDRLMEAVRAFGGGCLDVLFANAGISTFKPLADTTEADWDAVMAANLKGTYFTVQKAVPLMRAGGAIVLNASVAASKGNPIGSLYGASKAGVRSLGRTIAAELVTRGIRVSTVSPGPIETPIFDRGQAPAEVRAAIVQGMIDRNPMQRLGTVAEVAAAVLFLASAEASYITGVELLVDGGVASF
jgi:NAD(P)-dependent dehydrogenase (short-subunit alcohol dehydrogenase family)